MLFSIDIPGHTYTRKHPTTHTHTHTLCYNIPSQRKKDKKLEEDFYNNTTMVSRPYCPPPHPYDGSRYMSTRLCAPYSSYSERRYLPSHDARAITMADPQTDDNTPPRKRIAVAVSPDPGPSPTSPPPRALTHVPPCYPLGPASVPTGAIPGLGRLFSPLTVTPAVPNDTRD